MNISKYTGVDHTRYANHTSVTSGMYSGHVECLYHPPPLNFHLSVTLCTFHS